MHKVTALASVVLLSACAALPTPAPAPSSDPVSKTAVVVAEPSQGPEAAAEPTSSQTAAPTPTPIVIVKEVPVYVTPNPSPTATPTPAPEFGPGAFTVSGKDDREMTAGFSAHSAHVVLSIEPKSASVQLLFGQSIGVPIDGVVDKVWDTGSPGITRIRVVPMSGTSGVTWSLTVTPQ